MAFEQVDVLTNVVGSSARSEWRVLVVDGVGLRVVSSCASMSDLADVGVSGA